ncbi:serine/threonine-protein kinase [Allokutzneria albata]|uniref:Protein kinase domain-containing protein n=1 Tax=Allokutzneria albata TaxID=211114 RepID=A0A1G9URN9_ALLAB|nr:serine/threonine-protein kinase [Allokutzneria albata]SDM62579.1 Protein kinase domain-containing protein [Allokutzneria albata]
MAGKHAKPDPTLLDGRYQLEALIAQGCGANVHRATDTMLDRPVAVKIYHGGARQRFRAACSVSARLSHPNVATVFDAGTDNGRDYLVLRLVEGRTLADKLDWGPLEPGWVCRMGSLVAETLAHVHANGFAHGDVEPANILLGPNEQPYLAGFGSARSTSDTGVDVRALGRVLLEAVGPRPPEVIKAMVAEEPPSAAECARRLSATARRLGAAPVLPVCSVRPPNPSPVPAAQPEPVRRRGLAMILASGFAVMSLFVFPAGVLDATTPAPVPPIAVTR